MNAHSARPTGARGCQISSVTQRNACPNKVAVRRWTGRRWVALCRKHDLPAIGPLEVVESIVITGSRGAIEVTVTEASRP